VAAAVCGQWLLQCAEISWYNVKKNSCYRVGTMAARVKGQWLLQKRDSGCCSEGTVAAAVRGQWLLP